MKNKARIKGKSFAPSDMTVSDCSNTDIPYKGDASVSLSVASNSEGAHGDRSLWDIRALKKQTATYKDKCVFLIAVRRARA